MSSQLSLQAEEHKRMELEENPIESSFEGADEEMMHVINLIKAKDVLPFLRWADVSSSIHFRDSAGNSVIHWAAALGNVKFVTHLIFLGADVDMRNHAGASPLHCAVVSGHHAVAVQLLRHGADATCRNNQGQTFFDLLQLMGRNRLAHHYEQLKEILLSVDNVQCDDLLTTSNIDFTHKGLIGSIDLLSSNMEGTIPQYLEDQNTELSTRDTSGISSSVSNVVSQRAAWHREVELISALEAAERNALTSVCWEELLSLTARLKSCLVSNSWLRSPAAELSKHVTVVLGEKYSGGRSELMLLVGLEGQPEDTELWIAASRVAQSPVVKQYMERFDSFCTKPGSIRGKMGVRPFDVSNPVETSERRELPLALERPVFEKPEYQTSMQTALKTPLDSPKQSDSSNVAERCRTNICRITLAPVSDNIKQESFTNGPIQRQLVMSKNGKQSPDVSPCKTSSISDIHKNTSLAAHRLPPGECTRGQPPINRTAISRIALGSDSDGVEFHEKPVIGSCTPSTTKAPQSASANVEKLQSQHRKFNSVEERIAYDEFLYNSALRRLHVQKR